METFWARVWESSAQLYCPFVVGTYIGIGSLLGSNAVS